MSVRNGLAPRQWRSHVWFLVFFLPLNLTWAERSTAAPGDVRAEQKISATQGEFAGSLQRDDLFGGALVSAGDLDGDGIDELAVGVPGDDDGGSNRGAVWVLFLNDDGTVRQEQKISALAGGFSGALDDDDFLGVSLAALGDFDADGVPDLAVGANGDDDGGDRRGAVWILFLHADGTVKAHQKISSTQGGLAAGLDDRDQFGIATSYLADLDGDGVGDLGVGANLDDDGGPDRGALWIVFLNPDGTVKGEAKISDTVGGFAGALDDNDSFAISLAAIGDLDGDGQSELAAGARGDSDGALWAGAAWILFLNADGTVGAEQKISSTQGGFSGPLDNSDQFGTAVGALGDLDGDSVPDLAVGAVYDDDGVEPGSTDRGAVWFLFLNSDGTVKGERKISDTAGGFLSPLDNSDLFGQAVSRIGDVDGDSLPDVAVGSWMDDDGDESTGAVYVLFLEGPEAVQSVPLLPGAAYAGFALALGVAGRRAWRLRGGR